MNVAVFAVSSYEGVQKVFGEAKAHLGEILSAFEFFDKQSVSHESPIIELWIKALIGSMIWSRNTNKTTGKTRSYSKRNRISTA
jgi:hypothetical protein